MSDAKQIVRKWMEGIMLQMGFSEFLMEILGNSEKGDGYLGDITFVKVVGKNKTDNLVEFNYVIKSGKDSKELRKQAPVHEAYENEIFFYKTIYPAFKKYQLERNIEKPFAQVPKYIGALECNGIEVLVLENLKKVGFELHDRMKPLNLDHLKMTFEHYGKLHALSFALRADDPQLFQQLHDPLFDAMKAFLVDAKLMDNIHRVLQTASEFFKDDPIMSKKFKEIQDNAEDVMMNLLDPDDPYNVITHGDCWNNNFMFKYEDSRKNVPTDLRFLDWQLSSLAPTICDLSYHLYACASDHEFSHVNDLLEMYYRSLSDMLRQCHHDPNVLFPRRKLKELWKKYSPWGLIVAIFAMQFVISDETNAPDFDKVDADTDLSTSIGVTVATTTCFKERIHCMVVNHFNSEIV